MMGTCGLYFYSTVGNEIINKIEMTNLQRNTHPQNEGVTEKLCPSFKASQMPTDLNLDPP